VTGAILMIVPLPSGNQDTCTGDDQLLEMDSYDLMGRTTM